MVSTLQMAMALPNCVTGNSENEELGMPTEDACGGMWSEFGFGLFLILLSINLCLIFYIHVEMLQLENPIHQLHLIRQHIYYVRLEFNRNRFSVWKTYSYSIE